VTSTPCLPEEADEGFDYFTGQELVSLKLITFINKKTKD
jgi:hypothetical protein